MWRPSHVWVVAPTLLTQVGASQLRCEPQQQPHHSQPHLAARVEQRAPIRRARQRLSQLQPVRQRWPARRRLLPELPQQRDGTHAHVRAVRLAQPRLDLCGKQPPRGISGFALQL